MKTVSKLLIMSVLVVSACSKKDAAPSPTGAPAPAKSAEAVQSALEARKAAGMKKLNDDMLKKFLVYKQEILPSTKLAMDIATKGMAASGGDAKKMANEMSRDDRIKAMNEANENALKKSGLTMMDVADLTSATTEYYARRGVIDNAVEALAKVRKQIDEAKAAGKQPSSLDTAMEGVYAKQVGEFEKFKKDYAAKHGEDVVALLEKHAPAFMELQKKTMEMVLGGARAPKK